MRPFVYCDARQRAMTKRTGAVITPGVYIPCRSVQTGCPMPLMISITTQKTNEPSCRCPTAPHRPEIAPKTKRQQRNIYNDKAEAMILADQAGSERGWRKHYPKPANILFKGVKCLHSYKRREGCIKT